MTTRYGFAKYLRDALPNASFIGFTGTPIESSDVSTPAVFGSYVDIYDIRQAVEDGATVPIYYEARLAKVRLKDEDRAGLDASIDAVGEREELETMEKAKSKWSRIEAIMGHPDRIRDIAADFVRHYEARQEVSEGKAMIVAMSRRIAVEFYNAILELRPEWAGTRPDDATVRIVMTIDGRQDPVAWQKHITTKEERKNLAARFKEPTDPFRIVIVRDMWLTGFDAPCLGTLYVDKPMEGHNLMQAIARVNRVYKDKPAGLVVDYVGIASDLKNAVTDYTRSGGHGSPTLDHDAAVAKVTEKYDVLSHMLGSGMVARYSGADTRGKLGLILEAQDRILGLPHGKERFLKEVTTLSQAFSLVSSDERLSGYREGIAFLQAVKARLSKFVPVGARSPAELDTAVRQIVDRAIVSEGIVNVFDAAGLKKPDLSILSDDFLEEVRGMDRRNVALELLKKVLSDEIATRSRSNHIQSRRFSEMLVGAIRRYQNNLLTAAQVIDELISLAKDVRQSDDRGRSLGLSEYEVAFYDALADNASAAAILGNDTLRVLAQVLVERVRANTSIDWTLRESAQARLRVIVKRTLREYGYPPDMEALATEHVLTQAKLLAQEWDL